LIRCNVVYGRNDLVIQAHVRTLANHIINCTLQPSQIKRQALEYKQALGSLKSPARVQQTAPPGHYGAPIAGPSFQNYPSQPLESILLNSPRNLHTNLPNDSDENIDPQLRFHPYRCPDSAMGFASSTDNPSPPVSAFLQRESSAESLSPYDSISASGIYSRVNSQPPSRPASRVGSQVCRRSFYAPGTIPPDALAPPHWSVTRKKALKKRIVRLTASAGFSLSWTENPEWRLFCDEFVAGAPTISRKVLTKRILAEVVEEFRAEVRQKVAKQEATIQSDGWTGLNNHHLVAFMITADKKVCGAQLYFLSPALIYLIWQVHTVEVHNTTKERKTAENYLKEIDEVYNKLKDEWGVVVVGLVTDASGEARKARRLFARKYPFLIVLDCYSHQVSEFNIHYRLL
jgi:hypothetical protein